MSSDENHLGRTPRDVWEGILWWSSENVARKTHLSILVLGALGLVSCSDHGIVQTENSFLDMVFVSGTITAKSPPITPDPISCELVFVAKNNGMRLIEGLSIDSADVVLDSTNQILGTIAFTSDWDGNLSPSQQDTVRLTKVQSQHSLFDPPCGYLVYIVVHIHKSGSLFESTVTDNLEFTCLE